MYINSKSQNFPKVVGILIIIIMDSMPINTSLCWDNNYLGIGNIILYMYKYILYMLYACNKQLRLNESMELHEYMGVFGAHIFGGRNRGDDIMISWYQK